MKPSIFDFLDVVLFLQAHLQWRKKNEKGFSYSQWSHELNIGSKTILRFILQRKRRISEKTAVVLQSHLRLNAEEQNYFQHLLSYSQPRSEAERTAAGAKLIQLQRKQYPQTSVSAKAATADVMGPVILTLITFKDFHSSITNISKWLGVEEDLVSSLMQEWLTAGIIEKKGEVFRLPAEAFKIADAPQQLSLRKFHEYWLEKSKEAFNLDFKERRFRSLKFALSEEEFEVALTKINDFALHILNEFHTSHIEGRRLYMLENVLFPLTSKFVVDQERNPHLY